MNPGFGDPSWAQTFSSRRFGKYPSEEAIRFFFSARATVGDAPAALDIGCGAGAVAWFLAHQGARVTAMDGAPAALEQLDATLNEFASPTVVRVLGDIMRPTDHVEGPFALMVDHYALYANPEDRIRQALRAYHSLLAPGGQFLSCMFGVKCTGADTGERIAPNTFRGIKTGVHQGTGTITLWAQEEAEELLRNSGFRVRYREKQIHDREGLVVEKLIFHLDRP